jgi:hypothetical protein
MSVWTQKVIDLKALGLSYTAIGNLIGLAPSTVSDLAAGRYKSPRGDVAVKLAALHAKKVKQSKQVSDS